jgi:putative transposase
MARLPTLSFNRGTLLLHPADMADRDGAKLLLAPLHGQLLRLRHIWADSACSGTAREWMESTLGCTVEIVKHWWTGVRWVWVGPGQEPATIPCGFHILPRRWGVESSHLSYPVTVQGVIR